MQLSASKRFQMLIYSLWVHAVHESTVVILLWANTNKSKQLAHVLSYRMNIRHNISTSFNLFLKYISWVFFHNNYHKFMAVLYFESVKTISIYTCKQCLNLPQTIGNSSCPNRRLSIAKLTTTNWFLAPLDKLSSKLAIHISIAPWVVSTSH
jgi:hypothetical protein